MFGGALLQRSVLISLACFSFAAAAETPGSPHGRSGLADCPRSPPAERAYPPGVQRRSRQDGHGTAAVPAADGQTGNQQVVNMLKYFQGRYNMDLRTSFGKVAGGGITLAAGPQESALRIVESEDAKMLEEIHEFFLAIAKAKRKNSRIPSVKSAEYRGVTGWRFGPTKPRDR